MNWNCRCFCRRMVGVLIFATAFLAVISHGKGAGDDPVPAAQPPEPAAVVQRLHEALLKASRLDAEVGFEARREQLKPIITETFDIALIARLSLGSHWSDLTAEQQQRFTDLLRRYTVASYASRFKRDQGQRFEPRDVQEPRQDLRVVRTRFIDGLGKARRFDYQLRKDDSGWRIVNVAVDGVSDLAIKRAEYSDLYEKKGFDALATRLAEQLEALRVSKTDD